MPKESIKRVTKTHRKFEREGKELKAKKGGKLGIAANNTYDSCDGQGQRLDPSIAKIGLMKDFTLTRSIEDQLSRTPHDTSSSTLSKMKVSGKRKRTDWLDESVNFETDAAELEPQSSKKWGEFSEEDSVHCLPYPDPAIDKSLSEQSRRVLSYAYGRCGGIEEWKFNKARQNWLLRNIWSNQAVPENYFPLVIKYLVGIKGGAREKLIEECTSKMSTSEEQSSQPYDGSTRVGTTINEQPNTSRARSILHALHKSS